MFKLNLKKYLFLAALLFWFTSPVSSSVSGSRELVRLTKDSPAALTAGGKSLFLAVETALAEELSAGTTQAMKIGFYCGLAKEQWAWLAPEFEAWRFNGALIGISTGMPAPVLFNQAISPGTLSELRVSRTSDHTGQSLNEEIAFSTASFDWTDNRLNILPSTGSWEYNSTYNISVGTAVLSEDGVPVNALDFDFMTQFKYDEGNVIKPIEGNDTEVKIVQDVFSKDGYIQIDTVPAGALLASANAAFQSEYSGGLDSVTEIDYCNSTSSNGNCVKETLMFPYGTMLVTLPYNPAVIANPGVYVLNETTGKWEPLPTAEKTGSTVSAYAPHFSFFMVGGAVITSLSQAKVYPSPFRPNGPRAGTGAGKTGTDAGGITFVVPNGSRVEIYTARGELVSEGTNPSGGSIVWDTRTKSGNKAASGVYLYLIKSPEGRQTGKLAIIR